VADFDIQRFVKLSGPGAIDDLDWQEAGRAGVTDTEARILRYMADTETHTILYLRDLLAGHSAHDPEVTAFLSVWVYEELWHGRAIDMLLSAAGRPVPQDTFTQVSKNVSWREPIEALGSHLAANATPRFAAVHMAWGAINELTAAAAYKRLAQKSNNRVLVPLLGRIGKQERKHFAFYYQQAEKRLAGDKWAQRLCRSALKLAWTPVGSGVGHGDNMAFVASELFADEAGRAMLDDIDRTIAQLPGLSKFDLVSQRVGHIVAKAAAAA
jgi:rubrerythrin